MQMKCCKRSPFLLVVDSCPEREASDSSTANEELPLLMEATY